MFQFPNGSIKRGAFRDNTGLENMFQFPNGSIKSFALMITLVIGTLVSIP